MSLTLEPHGVEILPLEMGDHLDRATFHARYAAMPPGIKAELIDGVVFMRSPAKARHSLFCSLANMWLSCYAAHTPGTRALDKVTVLLSERSEPQPDASLVIQRGGQTRVSDEDWMVGAPELVVEVASSSVSYDLHQKKRAYEAAGVQEYVVIQVHGPALSWFILREGRYQELAVRGDGMIRSESFPGLWLEPERLLREDGAGVLAVLQQGLASPEHAAFVERLKAAAS